MLGVFLIGMLTRSRGSDAGNVIAITIALVSMIFLSGQHVDFMNMLNPAPAGAKPLYKLPAWMPVIKWTWFAMFGAIIVCVIGLFFRTPQRILDAAELRAAEAHRGEDVPVALRG
jgi:hypothetical protein